MLIAQPAYRTPAEKRYLCRHIFTDGRRCLSPGLRGEDFCYYHHTTRHPISSAKLEARKVHREVFILPNPEDRSSIQHSIGEVLKRIAANDIDPRRAGLLLYGLQIASLNLPKSKPKEELPFLIEEVTTDPIHGTIAPRCEVDKEPHQIGPAEALMIELGLNTSEEEEEEEDANRICERDYAQTLPGIQAEAASGSQRTRIRGRKRKVLVDKGNRHTPLPNPTRNPLDGVVTDIASAEKTRQIRLQKERSPSPIPGRKIRNIPPGAHKAPLIPLKLLRQPICTRIRPNHHEQRIRLTLLRRAAGSAGTD